MQLFHRDIQNKMTDIHDRVVTLIDKDGLDNLVRKTEIGNTRWQTVKYKKARVSGDEIQALCKLYPQYAYWLTTGQIIPEAGQVSPDYEELARLTQPQKSGTHD